MNNTLVKAFHIDINKKARTNLTDYEVFPDKELLESLRSKIIENLIDKEIPQSRVSEFLKDEAQRVLEGYDLSALERSHIFNLVDNEINGYGPLTEVLEDPSITEIMVNSPNEIYIEIDGKLIKDDSISFINDEHIIRTVKRIIEPLGRTIDTKNPYVDSRLPDGSRINAIIPPLSVSGPVVTIRKFKSMMTSIDDLIRIGTMTPYMARFLEAAIKAKLNILVAGGTGSGKTTLLNILSSLIEENERIITIEDAAELKLMQPHVISLETRSATSENSSEVTMRELVINALRMRPDRIIVGEVRGKEAFDMLQSMNTGHEGALSTIHANSCIDALNRLETLVLMSGMEIPIKAVRDYINNAIDIVVHIERMSDGKRKIISISEVDSLENNEIKLKEIFAFKQNGITDAGEVNGEFILYRHLPKVIRKIKSRGINSLDDIFRDLIIDPGFDLPRTN